MLNCSTDLTTMLLKIQAIRYNYVFTILYISLCAFRYLFCIACILSRTVFPPPPTHIVKHGYPRLVGNTTEIHFD